ncbi:MAG: hypothetical protein ACRENA_07595 [Vulcanimicrobiaceae bacterium]
MLALLLSALIPALPLVAERSIPNGRPVSGIRCDSMEGRTMHIHQHLAIFDHGKPVPIPDDVGRPLFGGCFYWLHTHTSDGIIHVESPVFRDFTLGNFFAIWAEPLSPAQVSSAKLRPGEKLTIWIDGHRYDGDPRSIPLTNHEDITIDVGAPARKPAPFTAWNGA